MYQMSQKNQEIENSHSQCFFWDANCTYYIESFPMDFILTDKLFVGCFWQLLALVPASCFFQFSMLTFLCHSKKCFVSAIQEL